MTYELLEVLDADKLLFNLTIIKLVQIVPKNKK